MYISLREEFKSNGHRRKEENTIELFCPFRELISAVSLSEIAPCDFFSSTMLTCFWWFIKNL